MRGFLIGEQGDVLEGDAFLALKLLIGDPPIRPAFPAKGLYRLDNALLLLLRLPCRCFVACNALDEDRLEPIRNELLRLDRSTSNISQIPDRN